MLAISINFYVNHVALRFTCRLLYKPLPRRFNFRACVRFTRFHTLFNLDPPLTNDEEFASAFTSSQVHYVTVDALQYYVCMRLCIIILYIIVCIYIYIYIYV